MSTEGRSEGSVPGRSSYRELFERSADAILIIEDETFVDCNAATVKMLRYGSKEELLQTHPSELSPPTQPDGSDSYAKANQMIAIAFERGSHRFEWAHRRADGEVFPVEVLLTALSEHGRRTLHVVWRDITRRKQLEEELRQAQKMEAIGKLTGGIAHDFNNLLVAVLGHAGLLRDLVEDHSRARVHVEEITHAGKRASRLVRQLLAFGRKQLLRPRVIDLNQLTVGMVTLLERLIGERITLSLQLTDRSIPIKADESQIEQVLLNLASNARDAMPEGGQLTIATTTLAPTAESGDAAAERPTDTLARLTVTDTGIGMDDATAARAFDPFYTTKGVGEGTGLGLATVHGTVEQSGGRVSLRSVPGQGTCVEILLPLSSEPLSPVAQAAPRPQPGRGESILLVEDEQVVSRLIQTTLKRSGYRVSATTNGIEALAAYECAPTSVDLLITDVIMPQMGGPELVSTLRERGHDPSVLFISGYVHDDLAPPPASRPDLDVLEKPFDADELLERVERALAAAKRRRGRG